MVREAALTLNYGAPFGYLFKDKNWFKKFAIASLLTYTLIGAAPIFGWMIEIVRQVARGEEPVIPEIKDWKTFWKPGSQFAFVNVVWLLPVVVAVIVSYLPLIFLNALNTEEMFVFVWGITIFCVLAFLLVFSIVYMFLVPAILVVLAETSSSWQAANPVQLWKTVRPQFIKYLIVFLIVGVALFNVTLIAAALTLFLLLPPMLVYTGLVTAHYAGQLARMRNP